VLGRAGKGLKGKGGGGKQRAGREGSGRRTSALSGLYELFSIFAAIQNGWDIGGGLDFLKKARGGDNSYKSGWSVRGCPSLVLNKGPKEEQI